MNRDPLSLSEAIALIDKGNEIIRTLALSEIKANRRQLAVLRTRLIKLAEHIESVVEGFDLSLNEKFMGVICEAIQDLKKETHGETTV